MGRFPVSVEEPPAPPRGDSDPGKAGQGRKVRRQVAAWGGGRGGCHTARPSQTPAGSEPLPGVCRKSQHPLREAPRSGAERPSSSRGCDRNSGVQGSAAEELAPRGRQIFSLKIVRKKGRPCSSGDTCPVRCRGRRRDLANGHFLLLPPSVFVHRILTHCSHSFPCSFLICSPRICLGAPSTWSPCPVNVPPPLEHFPTFCHQEVF